MTDQYQPVPPSPSPVPPPTSSGLSENSAGGLAYLTFIPAIIFLVMEPYNRSSFIKFHAWQEILLTGLYVVWAIIRFMLIFIMPHVFGLGILSFMIGMVVGLAFFILWLVALIQAFNGKKFSIPVIGGIAENMASK